MKGQKFTRIILIFPEPIREINGIFPPSGIFPFFTHFSPKNEESRAPIGKPRNLLIIKSFKHSQEFKEWSIFIENKRQLA